MIELTRTNDTVLISWLAAHLEAAGIGHVVLDVHTSILEGSIGAIPRRIMVLADDEAEARAILDAAPRAGDGGADDAPVNASAGMPAPQGA